MTEIKSTLDLVMEKTRHLRLSPEEKREQEFVAVKQKLGGLLQRYEQNGWDLQRFREEFDSLEQGAEANPQKILKAEVLNLLDLETPSIRLLALLQDLFRVDTARLASVIGTYQDAKKTAADKRSARMRALLVERRRISGSAVRPHLDADKEWQSELESLRTKFGRLLDQEKKLLKS